MPKYLSQTSHEAVREALQGFSFPGGYPIFARMQDGEAVCLDCLKLIVRATHDYEANPPGFDTQWAEVNEESTHLYCSNCSQPIPSAYGEDLEGQERLKELAMPLPEDDQP